MLFWKMGTSGKFLVWTVLVFALAIVGVGCGSSVGEDTVSDETRRRRTVLYTAIHHSNPGTRPRENRNQLAEGRQLLDVVMVRA